ncbi:DUF2231 domain-containing protein [Nocardioides sp. CER19]|uniref:DUF2231 domain-containing protein n=1 Tax=Nocardioides sp. CER19 TaxID=3038538 RepID=UPI00244C07FD|nr:DUF2231 domain-containing protein [Nocardioides sp. CER19]MDH2414242.1 hypothetical protein [Nocardioides sp. CER19]
MLDLIDGLPVHPLVVHAVVVLLPLAALGTLGLALVPRWRAHYGPLVTGIAALAAVLVPVATSSGEALEKHVGDPGRHAQLGDQLIWFAVPLAVLALVLTVLARRTTADRASSGRAWLPTAVAALAAVAAIATSVQVYRVGESGARAVWSDQVHSSGGR